MTIIKTLEDCQREIEYARLAGFRAGLKRALELMPHEKSWQMEDSASYNSALFSWKSNLESEIKENG